MRSKQRAPAQLARDRRKIADLYLQGRLQADIAAELKINQSTVSRDLKALHKEWLASALADFGAVKARELARIDRLELEYWQAWERSCKAAETIVRKQKGGGDKEGGVKEMQQTLKGQAGDPRFLDGVQWCIERRCKILGVDAPQRAQPNLNIDMSQFTLEQLKRVADGEDPIRILASTRTGGD